MRVLLAIVFLIPTFSGAESAQQQTGTICVAARIDDPFVKEPATLSNGEVNSHGLKFKIDKRPAVDWPGRKALRISDLDTSAFHTIAVLDAGGKPIESIKFKFSRFGSLNLCLSYDGYQGIGLDAVSRHTPWCKCR